MNDRSDELSTADLAGQRPAGDPPAGEHRADADDRFGGATDDRGADDRVVGRDLDDDLTDDGRTDAGFADGGRTDGAFTDDGRTDGGFADDGRSDAGFAGGGRSDGGFGDDRRAGNPTTGELNADERAANAEAAGLGTADDRAVDGGLSDDRPANDLPAGDPYAGGLDRDRVDAVPGSRADTAGAVDANAATGATPAAAPTSATPAGTNLTAPTGSGPTGTGAEGSTTGSGAPTGVDGPLMPPADSEGFRARWTDVQTGFVDEPRRAVEQADALVAELMQQLAKTFADERTRLEAQWDSGDDVVTDDLRTAFQRYRSFFERLLST